ncbi:acyl-ACP desaturase [Frankia sp. CNm7]|uniref:Acyl-ACP desaturase n=1 Tax=Frankia nepalensis TaxID=1836974 RepID=A0A937RDH4_9ACTN|nr:acyl-ACP desaturase [Frankia nepalensis]MBL7500514.1 acyl-ACP desaturase [Frankia nepalensis]MBL7509792.1 acyl-ACP desaturase [Frankia nepalensis]MBL7522192.1 acyl-ACP desaturase [Frankia nepalensis]MBL7627912.1 acyl-ACP desaturase [Frankia nepalensis]
MRTDSTQRAAAEPVGQAAGPLLPPGDVADAVGTFLRSSPAGRRWDVETAFDWAAADADRLTEGQRSAVAFITYIEDHLPGYFGLYSRRFPLDESVDLDTFVHNRELYHFTVRWAEEEDTHARALFSYQVAAGLSESARLRAELGREGRKPFTLPHEHAVSLFAYALVQEKATQIYYQQLRAVVDEPVLVEVLGRLSRDEARHFTFFADLVERSLRRHGDRVVEPIRDVVAGFRMPLADTMRGYWRWALKIADAAHYDHTDAYEHLIRVVNRAVDARTDRVDELTRFVAACRTPAASQAS